jgi:hypothetical protein
MPWCFTIHRIAPGIAGKKFEMRERGRVPRLVENRLVVFAIDPTKSGHAAQIMNPVQRPLPSVLLGE